jgi:hypothetical protein
MDHLINSTSFGLGSVAGTVDHPVMHDPLWAQIRTVSQNVEKHDISVPSSFSM